MTAFGRSNVWIADAGLVSPLGRNVLQAALSARAGMNQRRATNLGDSGWSPAMGQVADLPADCTGFDRLTRLVAAAASQLELPRWQFPIPVMLALPTALPDDDQGARPQDVFDHLVGCLGLPVDAERSQVIRGSHADGGRLFQHAASLVESGEVPAVLVGGADTYYHPAVVDQLRPKERGGGDDSALRFTPSEAAGLVLLASREQLPTLPHSSSEHVQALARLCSAETDSVPDETRAALAAERQRIADARTGTAPRHQPNPSRASSFGGSMRRARITPAQARARMRRTLALRSGHHAHGNHYRWHEEGQQELPDPTETMRQLVGGIRERWPAVPIEWALADVNGDKERAMEWARVIAHSLLEDVPQTRFVDTMGDVGAATAPVLVGLACGYWALGCAPGRAALIALHSEAGGRAALLLQQPELSHE